MIPTPQSVTIHRYTLGTADAHGNAAESWVAATTRRGLPVVRHRRLRRNTPGGNPVTPGTAQLLDLDRQLEAAYNRVCAAKLRSAFTLWPGVAC